MIDEDAWIAPTRWLTKAEPFRDVTPHRPVPVAADAPARLDKLLNRYRESIEGILDNARHEGNGELTVAGLAYLGCGEPSAFGAAAVAAIIRDDQSACCSSAVGHGEHFRMEIAAVLIDGWAVTQGISFAVDAIAHLGRLTVRRRFPPGGPVGWTPWNRYSRYRPLDWYDALDYRSDGRTWWGCHNGDLERLRAHLATAPDDAYAAAADRVEAFRNTGSIRARLVSSYLLPERQNWLDADLADPATAILEYDEPIRMLVASVTTPAQLDRITNLTGGKPLDTLFWGKASLYSMVCQVGPASVPALAALLDVCRTAKDIAFVAGILAQLPTDEAFQELLNRSHIKPVATALDKASARYPRRAKRLTAGSH